MTETLKQPCPNCGAQCHRPIGNGKEICDNCDLIFAPRPYPVGDPITLTPSLLTHYQQRSQDTGKTVNALVLADLTALLKKRTAREERRVWKEIEYERL